MTSSLLFQADLKEKEVDPDYDPADDFDDKAFLSPKGKPPLQLRWVIFHGRLADH